MYASEAFAQDHAAVTSKCNNPQLSVQPWQCVHDCDRWQRPLAQYNTWVCCCLLGLTAGEGSNLPADASLGLTAGEGLSLAVTALLTAVAAVAGLGGPLLRAAALAGAGSGFLGPVVTCGATAANDAALV